LEIGAGATGTEPQSYKKDPQFTGFMITVYVDTPCTQLLGQIRESTHGALLIRISINMSSAPLLSKDGTR
jgi:hypothetical protein